MLIFTLIWVSSQRSFPPAKYEYRWYQFGQRWWHQKWNKGQRSSRLVMGGMGIIISSILAGHSPGCLFFSLKGDNKLKATTSKFCDNPVITNSPIPILPDKRPSQRCFFTSRGPSPWWSFQPLPWPSQALWGLLSRFFARWSIAFL